MTAAFSEPFVDLAKKRWARAKSRQARSRVVWRLHKRGFNDSEAARVLGVSQSYVWSLRTDPSGEVERSRRGG